MNYYIQGCAAKADKIKAAFEKLGYEKVNVIHIGDYANERLFFFTENGKVRSILKDCGITNIIMTHPDYKELELPIEPKFKIGDEIKTGNTIETITEIGHATRSYYCESGRTISFKNQDLWHLVAPKPHYNIANFHAGMPVLVRADNVCRWDYSVFSRITGNEGWPFAVCNGVSFTQCIPFNEDTKHLLGTTDLCDERFINW